MMSTNIRKKYDEKFGSGMKWFRKGVNNYNKNKGYGNYMGL